MIKLENIRVAGFEPAVRGMRNPMNSWDKSDSISCQTLHEDGGSCHDCPYHNKDNHGQCSFDDIPNFAIGPNDMELMQKLYKAGPDHRKFMRMIVVYIDVTTHHTLWAEFDTYKVGTVRNSCSKMHKIHVKEFTKDDFSHEGISELGWPTKEIFETVIKELERLRNLFNSTQEKKYWRAMVELLPMGYNLKATVMLSYEVLANMYFARRNHKVFEWPEFCKVIENLPYFMEIIGENKGE